MTQNNRLPRGFLSGAIKQYVDPKWRPTAKNIVSFIRDDYGLKSTEESVRKNEVWIRWKKKLRRQKNG